ncbi:3TM-type holin [Planktotalea sp.]|uniref:3TM-type holin n=1 Tax=Planktotalea sp. TaxID=2029877 RepID=UPI0034206C93
MVDPIWFATRMQGVALVPESSWWLLGAIVSLYFGARHHVKTSSFKNKSQQRSRLHRL